MSDDYIDKVIRLADVPRPVEQPSAAEWQSVESEFGLAFPSDFVAIVSTLGYGCFGEFILFSPISSLLYTRLSMENILRFKDGLDWIVEKAGFQLFPNLHGYVPIGSADRLDLLMRRSERVPLGYELLWLEQDIYRAYPISMSLAQFLHDFYLGLIREKWAEEHRRLVWIHKNEPFFTSRSSGGRLAETYARS